MSIEKKARLTAVDSLVDYLQKEHNIPMFKKILEERNMKKDEKPKKKLCPDCGKEPCVCEKDNEIDTSVDAASNEKPKKKFPIHSLSQFRHEERPAKEERSVYHSFEKNYGNKRDK